MGACGGCLAADVKERGPLPTTRLPGLSTLFGRNAEGTDSRWRVPLAGPSRAPHSPLPAWPVHSSGSTPSAPTHPSDALPAPRYPVHKPLIARAPPYEAGSLTAWALTAWVYDTQVTAQERQERAVIAAMLGGETYEYDPTSLFPLPAAYDVNLEGFYNLSALPDGLYVRGTLNLNRCENLERLPSRLRVDGRLLLNGCRRLTTLSGYLTVGDNLEMDDCPQLHFIGGLVLVEGSLFARRCPKLVCLGEGIRVTGFAIFKGCRALRIIEQGAWFGGDLNLNDCTSLQMLPEGLHVGRALRMRGCVSLVWLPAAFYVGQDIDLTGCRAVSWLPDAMLTLGHPRPVGHLRQVRLAGTGLSYEACLRLSALQPLGMLFVFDEAPIDYADRPFLTLSDAIAFYGHAIVEAGAQEGSGAGPSDVIPTGIHAAPLLTFLARMLGTADFQNPNTRPFVARRVLQFIHGLSLQDSVHEACNVLIEDGLTHCLDNVQLLMSRLELVLLIDRAEQTDAPSQALKDLGLRMMRASTLDAHIAQRNAINAPTDEVEMHLAYHIALAPLLELPFSASGMYYGFFSCVTQVEVDIAADYVRAETSDASKVAAFFADWEPWRRHLRRKQAQCLLWHHIPVAPGEVARDDNLVCPITQTCYAELERPVYWRLGQNLQVCDYDSFIAWWAEHGTDPWLSQPIAATALFRLPPPLPQPRHGEHKAAP